MRDPAVREDHRCGGPEPSVAELPREVAELALFPAIPSGGLRDHGERIAAEQPVAPDGSEIRTGVLVERDRREHPRVEVEDRVPAVGELEHLELEDPLPADV